MHKVHMHAGAIRQLLHGCAYVREIIYPLKLVDFLPVHTHKPIPGYVLAMMASFTVVSLHSLGSL